MFCYNKKKLRLRGGFYMEHKNNGKSVASLVLGIIGVVLGFLGGWAWTGAILGIIGLILGVMGKKEAPSGMATAGIVLSIIAIALGLIVTIACYACVAAVYSAAGSLY